ncbi:hypothetical protein CPB83DRAFT_838548 [Crepidotus variabilis]|uniref:Uncharacterized protein n=1 Tax=Crepidotus variabilis TaxID=179855 RepID=A0A9P6E9S0_9AGAR|nr:hypothetical protein CPB83DRAFT_838548 [Crepidotus variabilis]
MDSASPLESAGGPGPQRSKLQRILALFRRQWPYIGFCIFLAVLNMLLGVGLMSYLKPKKEPLIFGIICLGVILGLAHFASLCYLIQRANNESSEPSMVDVAYSAGVVLLFAISGIALTAELPKKCFSGQNEDFVVIGRNCCNTITAMAASSWLAVLIMTVASIVTLIAARRAIEFAKLPPPVPERADGPEMRWINRNDPFMTAAERYNNV